MAGLYLFLPLLQFRQRVHNLHRLHAHGADALEEFDDLLLVVGEVVSVEFGGYGGVADFVFLPLVQHPFQAAAVAELVIPRGGGDAGKRGGGVNLDAAGFLHGFQLGLELRFLVRRSGASGDRRIFAGRF